MSIKRTLIASAFALAALPALAQTSAPMEGAQTAAPKLVSSPTAAQKPVPPPKPVKATPEERAAAERLEPLARSAFWAHEVDADPMDNDARLRLARALRALGRYDEAGAAADQLLVMQPNNLEALLESARDKVAANKGFYAIDDAERAAAAAPRDWRPQSLLAIAYEQTERDAEALQAHERALALAPENPATLTNLGMYYAGHSEPAMAEPLLRKAAAEPGATTQERQNLALVLGMEGKFAEAEQLQRRDLPPDQADSNLAYLHAAVDGVRPHTWESLKQAQ